LGNIFYLFNRTVVYTSNCQICDFQRWLEKIFDQAEIRSGLVGQQAIQICLKALFESLERLICVGRDLVRKPRSQLAVRLSLDCQGKIGAQGIYVLQVDFQTVCDPADIVAGNREAWFPHGFCEEPGIRNHPSL
jgi:hypothetical protein